MQATNFLLKVRVLLLRGQVRAPSGFSPEAIALHWWRLGAQFQSGWGKGFGEGSDRPDPPNFADSWWQLRQEGGHITQPSSTKQDYDLGGQGEAGLSAPIPGKQRMGYPLGEGDDMPLILRCSLNSNPPKNHGHMDPHGGPMGHARSA